VWQRRTRADGISANDAEVTRLVGAVKKIYLSKRNLEIPNLADLTMR
jgi:hypothetical protein